MLVLLAALPEEARGILKASHWRRISPSPSPAVYEGRIDGEKAVLAVSGVGRARAEAAVRGIMESHRPSAVLSIGFAGGLAGGQRPGDLIVARTLLPTRADLNGRLEPLDGERLDSDQSLTDEALRVLATLGLPHQVGACVTASHVISSADAKRRLGLATGALAVEQESFWIGLACRERDVPFLAVRSIIDPAERPLPSFAARFATDAKLGSQWRRALPIILRPRSIPALIRLAHAASAARDSLTAFTMAFLNSRTPGSRHILRREG